LYPEAFCQAIRPWLTISFIWVSRIRDRTTEGQHFRIAGLNLLTAIIIYWNTKQLGFAVAARQKAGLDTPAYLLSHISPLGWAHIILTGEYRWRQMAENP